MASGANVAAVEVGAATQSPTPPGSEEGGDGGGGGGEGKGEVASPRSPSPPCRGDGGDGGDGSGDAKAYVVYVLRSTTRPGRTYVGCTNDPAQRIRRHNGEICGGARYTRVGRPWRYAKVVRGFGADKCGALSFEWHLKHRSRRRSHPRGLSGIERRERGLERLLALPRWAARGLVVETFAEQQS